jgi:phosphoenolpyruvate-protein phosphotransferase (PTS system enzyme I)
MHLTGVGVSTGRCCARAHVYECEAATAAPVAHTEESAAARAGLDAAVRASHDELVALEADVAARAGAEHAAIFAAHRLVLDDDEWLGPIQARIDAGATPDVAVRAVSDELADELRALPDEYLRERASDIADVAKRVLRHLGCDVQGRLPDPDAGEVILCAYELTPSDTVGLDPAIVRGIVTEAGARTSHAAILARQLGIPAVVGVAGLLDAVRGCTELALDGDSGECRIDPPADVAADFRTEATVIEVVAEPVTTRDGVCISICANASDAKDVAGAVVNGADGIGLYRTEFLFLQSADVPTEEEQYSAYSAAAAAADGRPVVFRTLDVGAAKHGPGIALEPEENPFLGVRGIRLSLRRRELFAAQLRALARAAREHGNVRVMVPMVADLHELRQVHELVDELGVADALHLGTMIEVPSAALMVREMAPLARFFSVGTNDLTGYVMAVDRTNPALGGLYDELHPAVLRLLERIAGDAGVAGSPVSICGEIAGDAAALPVLVGLGFRALSVAAPSVPRLKAAVRELWAGDARELARRAVACGDALEVRALLAAHERVACTTEPTRAVT